MLVALDTRRAWRVESGSCSAGGATLATTTNGGKTWANTKAPLRAIVRVRPADNKAAFVIGADSSCAAELTNTTDGGGTWGSASAVGSAWFRDPKNPRVVGTPRASTSRPCGKHAVVDLAAVSTASARVLCADGLIRSTTNTASSWSDSGKVAGAVALAVLSGDPGKTYVAQLGAPQCAGVQVQQVGRSAATSCLETSVPEAQGQVALSLVKNGGWLAVGEKTMRSIDGLLTWSVS
jgi:hypothetical protein